MCGLWRAAQGGGRGVPDAPRKALLEARDCSPDPGERRLLSDFLKKASPAARSIAASVIQKGLLERTWSNKPAQSSNLPPYDEGR